MGYCYTFVSVSGLQTIIENNVDGYGYIGLMTLGAGPGSRIVYVWIATVNGIR